MLTTVTVTMKAPGLRRRRHWMRPAGSSDPASCQRRGPEGGRDRRNCQPKRLEGV